MTQRMSVSIGGQNDILLQDSGFFKEFYIWDSQKVELMFSGQLLLELYQVCSIG